MGLIGKRVNLFSEELIGCSDSRLSSMPCILAFGRKECHSRFGLLAVSPICNIVISFSSSGVNIGWYISVTYGFLGCCICRSL